jgi:hypothetical protein
VKEEERGRAWRRAMAQKKRKKWEKRVRNVWGYDEPEYDIDEIEEIVHLHTTTGKLCSCPMCGNPRRHFGEETPQEIKNRIDFREEVEESL